LIYVNLQFWNTIYKGNKDAVGMLVGKIKGGKGHPKIGATDDELKAAVERVLSTQ